MEASDRRANTGHGETNTNLSRTHFHQKICQETHIDLEIAKEAIEAINKDSINSNWDMGFIPKASKEDEDFEGVGAYHVAGPDIDNLGEGSFGSVIVGEKRNSEAHNKTVAVKKITLPGDKTKQSLLLKGCIREIDALSSLCHDNIVELLGVYTCDSPRILYIMLPYADKGALGKDSEVVCSTKTLDLKQLRCLCCHIASALSYLESQSITHCDIKPSNILDFSVSGGELKYVLSDFNSCINHSKNAIIPPDESTQRTLFFTSPENCEYAMNYTHASDMWAVGITLYLLHFRELPFTAENAWELFHVIPKFNPDTILQHPHSEHERTFRDLLKKLLCGDPKIRLTAEKMKGHSFLIGSDGSGGGGNDGSRGGGNDGSRGGGNGGGNDGSRGGGNGGGNDGSGGGGNDGSGGGGNAGSRGGGNDGSKSTIPSVKHSLSKEQIRLFFSNPSHLEEDEPCPPCAGEGEENKIKPYITCPYCLGLFNGIYGLNIHIVKDLKCRFEALRDKKSNSIYECNGCSEERRCREKYSTKIDLASHWFRSQTCNTSAVQMERTAMGSTNTFFG